MASHGPCRVHGPPQIKASKVQDLRHPCCQIGD